MLDIDVIPPLELELYTDWVNPPNQFSDYSYSYDEVSLWKSHDSVIVGDYRHSYFEAT